MKRLLLVIIFAAGFLAACSDIREEHIEYKSSDGTVMKGFLSYDGRMKDKRPGVLVVHEWWGTGEFTQERARRLARLGYTALAVDMFGEGKRPANADEAAALAKEVTENVEMRKERFLAALETLRSHDTVDPDRIAAIGFSFGGTVVLEMARAGLDLDGVVSFYGGLSTSDPAEPGDIKTKILVLSGSKDWYVSSHQIAPFKQEMAKAEANYRIIPYDEAEHGFSNPDSDRYGKDFGLHFKYSEDADKKSWEDMKKFLAAVFQS